VTTCVVYRYTIIFKIQHQRKSKLTIYLFLSHSLFISLDQTLDLMIKILFLEKIKKYHTCKKYLSYIQKQNISTTRNFLQIQPSKQPTQNLSNQLLNHQSLYLYLSLSSLAENYIYFFKNIIKKFSSNENFSNYLIYYCT
jgi:hypothetical protein